MTGDTSLRHVPVTSTTPPPAVAAFLDGSDLEEKTGTAIGVLTTDADGWPRAVQLSAGEVLLSPAGELRMALHAQSSTTANVRRDGRVVLIVAADGASHELRFAVTERAPVADLALATFGGRLVVAREHRSPYADVVDDVRFELHDTAGTLVRWRRQLGALRDL